MRRGRGRGRPVEEIDRVEERAGAAALRSEAAAELLDLVAALARGLGRGGRVGDGRPVGGGQVRPSHREASRGVGAGEREGLVGGPARRRHAAAAAGGGRGVGGEEEAIATVVRGGRRRRRRWWWCGAEVGEGTVRGL